MPEPTDDLYRLQYDEGPTDLSRVLNALRMWELKESSHVDVCDQYPPLEVNAHEVSHDKD